MLKPVRKTERQPRIMISLSQAQLKNNKVAQHGKNSLTSSLLELPDDLLSIITWSRNKKGLAIFPKCQLIRFLQFTAWGQQILRERKFLLWLEAKLCCILNRCINHLACQLERTCHWNHLVENPVTD